MNAVNKSGRKMDGLPAVIPIISSKQPPLLFETRLHLSYETTVILHFRRLFVSAWPLQNVHALVVLLSVKYVFLVSSLLLSLLTSKTVEEGRQINYRHQLYVRSSKVHETSWPVTTSDQRCILTPEIPFPLKAQWLQGKPPFYSFQMNQNAAYFETRLQWHILRHLRHFLRFVKHLGSKSWWGLLENTRTVGVNYVGEKMSTASYRF